ncbi:DNA-formamidopyrimidine glycosylase [Candidatus Saccharibacteria bacterium]|nr:MAG: DNA-formamidopyrimidine glycosylase [Candidatus Saccharibacteria bacterium]
MPELPEVETVRRGLDELLAGRKVDSCKVYDSPRSFPNSQLAVDSFLFGSTVKAVRRRAKVLIIDLDNDYSLVIHLKMTGQLVFVGSKQRFGAGHPNDSLIAKLPDRSTRVSLGFADGSYLYFNDQRKFGWIKLLPTAEVPKMPFMQKVGPEPLEDSFTAEDFIARIRRRSGTTVKAAILDQTTLAGVGNIYADESLWSAKIHPSTRVGDITDQKLAELLREIKAVMTLSIEKGGSTDRNYVNAKGERGSYLQFANVFRREGQACKVCNTTIDKIRVAGRGTHICPTCQVI